MLLALVFYLFVFGPPVLALLLVAYIANRTARALMSQGLRRMGFAVGLLLFVAVFVLGWLALVGGQQAEAFRRGPCYVGEGFDGISLLPGWRIGGPIAGVALLIMLLRTRQRVPEVAPSSSPDRLRRLLLPAIGVVVAVAGIAVAMTLVNHQAEPGRLLAAMAQDHGTISSARLRELGSITFTVTDLSLSGAKVNYVYVKPDGLKFSDDGRWLSLEYDGEFEIWRLADLKMQRRFQALPDERRLIAFSPDGSRLAVWTDRVVSVYAFGDDLSGPLWQWPDRGEGVVAMAFSADSRELILITGQAIVAARDVVTGEVITSTQMEGLPKHSALILSPDGNHVAISAGSAVQVLERRSGRVVADFESPTTLEGVASHTAKLVFLRNNALLFWDLGDCWTNCSWVRDMQTGALTPLSVGQSMSAHGHGCGYSAFSPDGRLGVFGTLYEAQVWDLASNRNVGSIPAPYAVTAVSFSPDQRLLAVATADGRLRFFAAD
jgi:hypothetical protein